MSFNLYVLLSCFWKKNNIFWENLILIAFYFKIKIYFFDKMIFLKILNKHLKIEKSDFVWKYIFFLKKNLNQTARILYRTGVMYISQSQSGKVYGLLGASPMTTIINTFFFGTYYENQNTVKLTLFCFIPSSWLK